MDDTISCVIFERTTRRKGTHRQVTAQADNKKKISDEQLLQLHLDGDSEAFTTLVKRYERELLNFLYRFTGNLAMAEDVFQDAFLQVHISGATFDMTRRLKPWMFTIAANKARDALRSRSRRPALPLDAPIGGEGGTATFADLIPANIPAPDETLSNFETRQAVQNIVKDMPDNLRMVLVLSYFHGFAYKDIAEILEVPLGTLKSRLHAAVKHFARQWKAAAERSDHDRETK